MIVTSHVQKKAADGVGKKTLVFILGNLTAFGPFVTDFYLPCLPELTNYFSASASVIQISLTAGMLGLALGQLLIGPISDKYGRKLPLLWCLFLFVVATVGCILSKSIVPFICFRLLQGVTGASGLVISKVIIADSFSAADLTKYFAILAAVQGTAPIVAPVVGGVAFSLSSWQGTFGVLSVWALVLLLVCLRLRETLPVDERLKMPVYKTFVCYADVVRNKYYLLMNLLQGFGSAALMSYISASPFIFQNHFGLTPLQYGLCFAGNAVGLVLGSSIVMKISNLKAAAKWGTLGLLCTSACMSCALLLAWPFAVFEVFLFPMLFCVGVLTPVGTTCAMSSVAENRGMAAALVGAVPFLLGGIVAPLTGIGDMTRSMPLLVMICSVICTVLWLVVRRWDNPLQHQD